MEILDIVDIPAWLLCCFLTLTLGYIYSSYKHVILQHLKVPGPKPWPFVGNLPGLLKKGPIMLDKENMKKYGKCFGFCMGNTPVLIITDTSMIKEIFVKQFSNFTDRAQYFHMSPFMKRQVLNATGVNWKFLRTSLTPVFTSGKIKGMQPLFLNCLDRLVANIEVLSQDDDVMDMEDLFGGLTFDIICSASLGLEVDTQQGQTSEVVECCKRVVKLNIESNPIFMSSILIPELKNVYKLLNMDVLDTKSMQYIRKTILMTIEERKHADPKKFNDLLQHLVNSQKDSTENMAETNELDDFKKRGLSYDEIVANAKLFLLAGYDTTKTALTFACYFLATEPACQEKLVAEIDNVIGTDLPSYANVSELPYMDMFISESLRLYPSVTKINREAVADTEVNGIKIPKGMKVDIPVYVLHRMSEYWEDPDKFIPERFAPENKANIDPYSYMPFGMGPRNCIGQRMALLEIKMTLVKLLQRYTILPSPGLKIPAELKWDIFAKPVGGMKLKLVKRQSERIL